MIFKATYFGSSSWLIDFNSFRILIDPWFHGDLVFAPGPWLIKGKLKTQFEIPDCIDLILLTQGLPDHSHPPSLNLFDRSIPVVASMGAARVSSKLGFKSIIPLRPGENVNINNLKILATAGASVPTLENGYIVSKEGRSFYVEPHGFLDPAIEFKYINTVISPVVNLKLPLGKPFIQGKSIISKLVKCFNPDYVFASTTGGDAIFSGILNHLITVDGTIEEASKILSGKTQFINPEVGETYELLACKN